MGKYLKVLVVHREDAVVSGLKAQFTNAGWVVRTYTNGLDSLMQARIEHYDLLLCGMDLPVVTGIEMVRSLRNFSINKVSPVIFLANGSESEQHHSISLRLNASMMTSQELIDNKVVEQEVSLN